MTRTYLALAAALTLAACGQGASPGAGDGTTTGAVEARALGIVGQIRSIFRGVGSDNSVDGPRDVPGGFTPEAIAAEPEAYRLVQINALGLQEIARVVQVNGPEVTLALQSGPSAAFDQGILVATRGFGDDLYTMESADLPEVLRAGGGTVTRRMESLDSQDQVQLQTFTCTVTAAGSEAVSLGIREVTLRRMDESCRSPALAISNIYWLDTAGEIVSSRQYVSPTVAYLRSNRL